jgi:hypothetical protein
MKKHLFKIFIGLFSLLIVFFLSRYFKKEEYQYKQIIKSPVPANDLSFNQYSFDVDSGIVVERPTGTVIKIPSSAFVNSKGELVKGIVTLKVREFHNPEDLFRSGIPMSIDSSRSSFLASAGMIEIRAMANDENLELASNKSAEISLASFKNAEGYRLYFLKDDKNWTSKDTFVSITNEKKAFKLNSLNQQLTNDTTDEIIVDFVSDFNTAPELIPFKGLQWKVKTKDITDEFQEAMRTSWNKISVSRRGNRYKFNLEMSLRSSGEKEKVIQKFSFFATPTKNGNSLSKNELNDISRANDSVKIRIQEEIERVKKEADLLNSFKISQMGIWNVDKIMKTESTRQFDISFDFEKEFNLDYSNLALYVLFLDDNSVIPFYRKDWNLIPLQNGRKMMFKAVLPNRKIAVVDENVIEQVLSKSSQKLYFTTKRY